MPDFQQFAERCKSAKYEHGRSGLGPSDKEALDKQLRDDQLDSLFEADLNDLCEQAERHARLLQQIWEWANSAPNWDDASMDDIAAHFEKQAKAHVRSLLVGQTEEK